MRSSGYMPNVVIRRMHHNAIALLQRGKIQKKFPYGGFCQERLISRRLRSPGVGIGGVCLLQYVVKSGTLTGARW